MSAERVTADITDAISRVLGTEPAHNNFHELPHGLRVLLYRDAVNGQSLSILIEAGPPVNGDR